MNGHVKCRINEQKEEQVMYLLQNTKYSYEKIARITNVPLTAVQRRGYLLNADKRAERQKKHKQDLESWLNAYWDWDIDKIKTNS